MPTFPPTRWAETGDVETPNDDYVADGFQDDVPVPAAYLNWALSHVVAEWAKIGVLTIDELGNISTTGDLTVDDITADTAAIGGGYGSTGTTLASNGDISTNGNLVVDGSGTFGGGYGGSGSTLAANGDASFDGDVVIDGDLTHGTATNYANVSAVGFIAASDPLGAVSGLATGFTFGAEDDYTYVHPTISNTTAQTETFRMHLPTGATPGNVEIRCCTPTGGTATGTLTVAVLHTKNTLTGTTSEVYTKTVTPPAAGNVLLTLEASGFSAAASGSEFVMIIGIQNDTGTPAAEPVAFISARLAWSFTQPGAF